MTPSALSSFSLENAGSLSFLFCMVTFVISTTLGTTYYSTWQNNLRLPAIRACLRSCRVACSWGIAEIFWVAAGVGKQGERRGILQLLDRFLRVCTSGRRACRHCTARISRSCLARCYCLLWIRNGWDTSGSSCILGNICRSNMINSGRNLFGAMYVPACDQLEVFID